MTSPFQARCIALLTILVIGLSVLSWRLVQIQLVDRQRYAESSRKAFHRIEKLPAVRGMIVDSREEPIAKSIPVSTLFQIFERINLTITLQQMSYSSIHFTSTS